MNALYIAWQDPQTRLWYTVGQLSRENDIYTFAYTRGALASPRFKYLGRMRDLYKSYYSYELFPLFANRVLNSSRPEYPDYVRWLAMDPATESDPMQLLAVPVANVQPMNYAFIPVLKSTLREKWSYFFSVTVYVILIKPV